MKAKKEELNRLHILRNDDSLSNREILSSFLKQFRQKLGYYSMFTALPAILTAPFARAQSEEAKKPEVSAAEQTIGLAERLNRNRVNPGLLRRRNSYLLPHQKGKYSNILPEMAGGDNCPGSVIPGGNYTAAAPFTDNGNTTGANNTVHRLTYNYYYSYNRAHGPDQIYTFTLRGRGPNPKIEVSATSPNYKPMIYILAGDFSGACPGGTGNFVSNWGPLSYAASSGGTATLDSQRLNWLPLNVPLYLFIDSEVSGANDSGPYTLRIQDLTIAPASPPRTKSDFDGDGKADISVFRPSDRVWYLNRSTLGFSARQFGLSTDKIVPADYDGDGRTEIAVYRNGTWYWLNSSDGSFNARQFGTADDIPLPADFSGDGRAELVVYRGGIWYTFNLANNQFQAVQFGLSTDKPVVGDYDGDSRADFAVYRDGIWYLLQSQQGFAATHFGLPTDKLVPDDYDGDRKTDFAVYRDGVWYVLRSQTGFAAFQFGSAGDIPAPADYDGDGKADASVFRDGVWFLLQSTSGFAVAQFGLTSDKPVPSALLP